MASDEQGYNTFADFYPFYLSEHSDRLCRRCHFIGSTLAIVITVYALIASQWLMLLLVPIAGYGSAWVGHFFFEHNRPATFTYPLYSLMGDWVMYRDMLTGRISF